MYVSHPLFTDKFENSPKKYPWIANNSALSDKIFARLVPYLFLTFDQFLGMYRRHGGIGGKRAFSGGKNGMA